MTPAELKAILKTTDTFAVARVPITVSKPMGRKSVGLRQCPTGLRAARVIKTNAVWHETFTLACGDQTHTMERRNGVLIEFELPRRMNRKLPSGRKMSGLTYYKELPDTEIVRRDGKRYVQMVVARNNVYAPWGEYAMIEAEREKEAEEHAHMRQRVDNAVQALGADHWRIQRAWAGHPPEAYITIELSAAEALVKELDRKRRRAKVKAVA